MNCIRVIKQTRHTLVMRMRNHKFDLETDIAIANSKKPSTAILKTLAMINPANCNAI